MKYFAIVPAAGVGRRFDHATPKQFLNYNGRALIEYAIEPLLMHPLIDTVVVPMTLPSPYWGQLAIAKHPKIRVTEGGTERADSVLNGLLALAGLADENDWVLVHDAARPCLTRALVQKLIEEVADHPVGGILALPVRDTLKRGDAHQHIRETVSRESMWQAQTPQQCRYGLLKNALLELISAGQSVTDDAQALECCGYFPKLVEGSLSNFKLTHPQDFDLITNLIAANKDHL